MKKIEIKSYDDETVLADVSPCTVCEGHPDSNLGQAVLPREDLKLLILDSPDGVVTEVPFCMGCLGELGAAIWEEAL